MRLKTGLILCLGLVSALGCASDASFASEQDLDIQNALDVYYDLLDAHDGDYDAAMSELYAAYEGSYESPAEFEVVFEVGGAMLDFFEAYPELAQVIVDDANGYPTDGTQLENAKTQLAAQVNQTYSAYLLERGQVLGELTAEQWGGACARVFRIRRPPTGGSIWVPPGARPPKPPTTRPWFRDPKFLIPTGIAATALGNDIVDSVTENPPPPATTVTTLPDGRIHIRFADGTTQTVQPTNPPNPPHGGGGGAGTGGGPPSP